MTTAPHWLELLETVMLAGQVIVQSTTLTVKLHIAVLVEASVAVQVTVVVPTGKVTPRLGYSLPSRRGSCRWPRAADS